MKRGKHKGWVDCVISHCSEDMSWLSGQCAEYKNVYVYTKCKKKVDIQFDNVRIIELPNIGSCDYVYLHYIINNYDSLPEAVVFGKGKDSDTKHNSIALTESEVERGFYLNSWSFSNNSHINFPFVKSGFSNLKEWLHFAIGDTNAERVLRSKYKVWRGYFTATRSQITSTPIEVWKAITLFMKHPNEEVDHYVERIWGGLLDNTQYEPVNVDDVKRRLKSRKKLQVKGLVKAAA